MLALTYSARQFPFFKMCVDGLKLYEVPYFVCQWLLEFDNPPPKKNKNTSQICLDHLTRSYPSTPIMQSLCISIYSKENSASTAPRHKLLLVQ